MANRNYRNLIVWQKSMDVVVQTYQLTAKFPNDEKFGIISQMRRCAVSIPSNIAEGSRRESEKEFRRFILISFGSGAELETQLEISRKLNYVSDIDLKNVEMLLEEVMKMLNKLQSTLKN
ncbi:MAG: four helix bundle protein [Patescibacteria group bacterium]|nr:four helix bundle protein [Patescibacteria group bacterium]